MLSDLACAVAKARSSREGLHLAESLHVTNGQTSPQNNRARDCTDGVGNLRAQHTPNKPNINEGIFQRFVGIQTKGISPSAWLSSPWMVS